MFISCCCDRVVPLKTRWMCESVLDTSSNCVLWGAKVTCHLCPHASRERRMELRRDVVQASSPGAKDIDTVMSSAYALALGIRFSRSFM